MQKNKTSFSIVIIGFNTSLELKRLLDSVENIQYYKENKIGNNIYKEIHNFHKKPLMSHL